MQDHSITVIFYIDMSSFSQFVSGGGADKTGWVYCYGEPRDGRVKLKAHYDDVQIGDREINNHLYPMVRRLFFTD